MAAAGPRLGSGRSAPSAPARTRWKSGSVQPQPVHRRTRRERRMAETETGGAAESRRPSDGDECESYPSRRSVRRSGGEDCREEPQVAPLRPGYGDPDDPCLRGRGGLTGIPELERSEGRASGKDSPKRQVAGNVRSIDHARRGVAARRPVRRARTTPEGDRRAPAFPAPILHATTTPPEDDLTWNAAEFS